MHKNAGKYMPKGMKRSVTKKQIGHNHYKTCLSDKKQTRASANQFQSHGHEIYSITLE